MRPGLEISVGVIPLEVNRAERELYRRVFVTSLGLSQLRWLLDNVPGFREARVALGQWRTRVMLDRYRRSLVREVRL
jgi:hypothetical protein